MTNREKVKKRDLRRNEEDIYPRRNRKEVEKNKQGQGQDEEAGAWEGGKR